MGTGRDCPQRLRKAAPPPPRSGPKEAPSLQNGGRTHVCCLRHRYIYDTFLERQEDPNLTTDDGRAFGCLGVVARAGAVGRGPAETKALHAGSARWTCAKRGSPAWSRTLTVRRARVTAAPEPRGGGADVKRQAQQALSIAPGGSHGTACRRHVRWR